MPPEGERCPACNARLVSAGREYVAWCRSCDYNVDPIAARREQERSGRSRWLDRRRRAVERRVAATLFDELARRDSIAKPGWDLASIAATLIALAVYAFELGLIILAVWGLVLAWRNPAMDLLAFLLLGVAYLMRPRLGKRPPGEVITREQAPRLYGMVDAMTALAGGPRIDTIILDDEFNAYAYRIGLRRRPVLGIGLPLWNVLGPQQRVAVLGHEIGHFVNGDLRRSFLIGSALHAVAAVYHLLRGAANGHDMVGRQVHWASMLARPLLWLLSLVPLGFYYAFLLVMQRSGQRAEYLADQLGARLSGRDAAIGLMRSLILGTTCESRMRLAARRGSTSIWRDTRDELAALPPTEVERLWRRAELAEARVDSSHPPTPLRRRLLEATSRTTAEYALDTGLSRAIDAELAPMYARATSSVRDADRAAMLWP